MIPLRCEFYVIDRFHSFFVCSFARLGVAPDEHTALRLFESLSRLGQKKQTIRSAKLKQFLQAYKVLRRRVVCVWL